VPPNLIIVISLSLTLRGKILGLKISESKNAWDDAQWALEAYVNYVYH